MFRKVAIQPHAPISSWGINISFYLSSPRALTFPNAGSLDEGQPFTRAPLQQMPMKLYGDYEFNSKVYDSWVFIAGYTFNWGESQESSIFGKVHK